VRIIEWAHRRESLCSVGVWRTQGCIAIQGAARSGVHHALLAERRFRKVPAALGNQALLRTPVANAVRTAGHGLLLRRYAEDYRKLVYTSAGSHPSGARVDR
jgi:hypothetical protein